MTGRPVEGINWGIPSPCERCGTRDAKCGRYGGLPCCKGCIHLRESPHASWFARLRARIFGRPKSVYFGGQFQGGDQ